MGYGAWTTTSYVDHSTITRGFNTMADFATATTQQLYKSSGLNEALNPNGVMRECRDSNEHPNTKPVMLFLDVTGSMGSAASTVAKQLNDIMESLYGEIDDVQFLTGAIGDLGYDRAPLQVSQFESDIRIAEQLEKIYFEGGGGGNRWESYTEAWYFALHNTILDCHERNQKGLIITMGDEPLNPYLPARRLGEVLGVTIQDDIDTTELYEEVTKKFEVYHICINDPETSYGRYKGKIDETWGKLLGDHCVVSTCNNLYKTISDIILTAYSSGSNVSSEENMVVRTEEGISW